MVLSLTEEGCSLREIAEQPGMPDWPVLRRHVRGSGARAAGFARARMLAAEAFEDRLIKELETIKGEDTAAMRLRIDTLKWLMARRAPARYGEKVEDAETRPERPAMVRRVIIDPPALPAQADSALPGGVEAPEGPAKPPPAPRT
ncbi:MAG: hypothetical protein ABF888_11635 [Acetobacter papayae]|uniref:terminase small subunit-like protein n=1 Tax=Acetobacter papayae TaxID=1076592 RepID=UPI0039E8171C